MYDYHSTETRAERVANGRDHCESEGPVYDLSRQVSGRLVVDPERGGNLTTRSGRRVIYAVDRELRIHVGFDGERETPHAVKHETLFHNAPVEAAGEMEMVDGVVTGINDQSGSYGTTGLMASDRRIARSVTRAAGGAGADDGGGVRLAEGAGRHMTTATETPTDLLVDDIDDLTSLAAGLGPDRRNALLTSAAEVLARPAHRFRFKLIGFIQALAATRDATLNGQAAEKAAIALIPAAHATDPRERLAALRALAAVIAHTDDVNLALAHSILATFEHARIDSSREVAAFAAEILSDDNPVFRRLISFEAATADAGMMASFLQGLLGSDS